MPADSQGLKYRAISATATAPAATAAAAHQSWWARNPPPVGTNRAAATTARATASVRASPSSQEWLGLKGVFSATGAAQIPKVTRPWATRNRPSSTRSTLTASFLAAHQVQQAALVVAS